MLVAREVIVPNYLRTPPLFDVRHPLPVLVALVANVVCRELTVLGRFILYYDRNFTLVPSHPVFAQLVSLLRDLHDYDSLLHSISSIAHYTENDYRKLLGIGLATYVANGITRLPEARQFFKKAGGDGDWKADGGQPSAASTRNSSTSWSAALWNAVAPKAICNVALPTVAEFRRAFDCGPHHRLVTNFTWPQLSPSKTTRNASV
ncbi:hypothetical protein MRX96_042476 [Rhipicephalus microplus]